MPNNAVFNVDPDSLRSKVYGSQNQPISTDASGKLEIRSISDAITVTADNLDIRDLTATTDNLQIYGYDGADVQPISTDTSGKLEIRSISDSVTVTADNLDIRDLTATTDNLQIYGYDGTDVQPIRTDTSGRLEIRSISDPVTTNEMPAFSASTTSDIATGDTYTPLTYVDTSTQTVYTFLVYNKGPNSADVRLDVSADQGSYVTDIASRTLASGSSDTFVAKTFLRYTRIAYMSSSSGSSTTLDVFFQTQS